MKVLIDVNYVPGKCGLGYTNTSIYVLSTCCGSSMTDTTPTGKCVSCDNCDREAPNAGRWKPNISLVAAAGISAGTIAIWVEYWTGVENVKFHVSGLDS